MAKLVLGLAALAVAGCSQAAGTNNIGSEAASNAANAVATANEAAPANATATAPAQGRGVDDPRAFVAGQYRAYQTNTDSPVESPVFAYSDRLRALFADYDAHQSPDEVGALDFDWWIDAQDWELHDVAVTEADTGPEARTVTARFRNIDRQEEVRFLFVRQNGRWYLDDAVQGSGHGDDGWTLSAVLRVRG